MEIRKTVALGGSDTWKFQGNMYITSEFLKRSMMHVSMVASEKFSIRGLFGLGNRWDLGFVRLKRGENEIYLSGY